MGSIIARGNVKSVQVEGSGVSKIYLKGSMRTVYVRLAGISEIFLDPSTGTAALGPIFNCNTTQNTCSAAHIAHLSHTQRAQMPDSFNANKHKNVSCYAKALGCRVTLVSQDCICLCTCPADDVKISGSVDSLSKVHYTRGQCDMGRVRCRVSRHRWLCRYT